MPGRLSQPLVLGAAPTNLDHLARARSSSGWQGGRGSDSARRRVQAVAARAGLRWRSAASGSEAHCPCMCMCRSRFDRATHSHHLGSRLCRRALVAPWERGCGQLSCATCTGRQGKVCTRNGSRLHTTRATLLGPVPAYSANRDQTRCKPQTTHIQKQARRESSRRQFHQACPQTWIRKATLDESVRVGIGPMCCSCQPGSP